MNAYLVNKSFLNTTIIAAFVFLFISTSRLCAQVASRMSVSGTVIDTQTGTPLHLVNVFLANTTIGDATDKEGRYLIENIPPGMYELVVTMIGYEAQKKKVELSNNRNVTLHFSLNPKILEGEEVVVTAEDAKEWQKNLRIFESVFFGVKEFAKECKLLNPEVLDFNYEWDSGHFRASAEQPFRVINHAPGYKVTVVQETFFVILEKTQTSLLTVENVSYKKEALLFNGAIRFEELTAVDNDEKQAWIENRLLAYRGSQRHFLRALWEGKLKGKRI